MMLQNWKPNTSNNKRRFRPLVGLIVAVLGLAVLMAAQQLPNRHRMEADLTQRSTQALHSAGLSDVRVTFTGRDGWLTAGSPAEAEQALDIVRPLEGVRAAEAQVPPAPAKAVLVPPSALVVMGHGTASVSGTVPSESARTALVGAAAALDAESVEDRLTVDAGVTDAALPGLADVLRAIGHRATGATVQLDGGTLTVSGAVSSEAHKNAVLTAARATGAPVVDQLAIPDVAQQLRDLPQLTFASGGDSLTTASEASLVMVSRLLKANPSTRLRIEGHTDATGSAESNLVLSRARAEAVQDFLAAQGVAVDRLSATGFGETRLKVPDTSAANRAENRRVELLTGDGRS
ncbi:outer membrane protein OmpA-like peptidoglycan-associated protein [Micromonospora violae]|uniref:Outer membrane protein OmpA-like peptidoglycan-associated protein n=1 Tax=Micromonospora violae TaxID=1278207 RepID=A0A4Q7UCN8_9ACTN|nr:OmpA family protein [Micromonospora violae]RZT78826.1 outer membrane protein OmpA-like peptidoglycan-associated protein [Micromonospora violae]